MDLPEGRYINIWLYFLEVNIDCERYKLDAIHNIFLSSHFVLLSFVFSFFLCRCAFGKKCFHVFCPIKAILILILIQEILLDMEWVILTLPGILSFTQLT